MKDLYYQNLNDKLRSSFHTPFFSVIIATYNRAHLIKRALNSLLAQTEKDWEAIIVDDDSTDDTYSVILPYIKTYPGIKYIRKAHGGEVSSKNAGMWSAGGKFITFLDSDDEYDVKHLELRKIIFQQNPEIKFVYGGAKIIGNQYVPDRFSPERMIHLSECVIGGTFFIDRNILIALSGFKEMPIGTDADLFDRIKEAGILMIKTDKPTYIYHHETEDSITNKLHPSINYS